MADRDERNKIFKLRNDIIFGLDEGAEEHSQGMYYYHFRQSHGRECLCDRDLTPSKHEISYFAKYLSSLDSSRISKGFISKTISWIRLMVLICLALVMAITVGTLTFRRLSWRSIDGSLTSILPQRSDCDNNGVYFDSRPFLNLYQLDRETHQAVFDEIGHVELLEDRLSNYFVSRITLNKTVLHLTGRFACLLREHGTSDREVLHADVIGEIRLLATELSSLLSQLSQQRDLSNAVYSLYSAFISTAAEEADSLRPSKLKTIYLIYEPPALEWALKLIGRDLGEEWWIPWEGRKFTMELAQLGLSTIQTELSSLDQILKMIEELRARIESLPQLLRHEKGWRFSLRQYTLRSIDYLFFSPEEWIKRRAQETDRKSNMLRSWYRDNIIWNLHLQDAALLQPLRPCSWGVQLNCSQ